MRDSRPQLSLGLIRWKSVKLINTKVNLSQQLALWRPKSLPKLKNKNKDKFCKKILPKERTRP